MRRKSKVDLFTAIRRDSRIEGLSIRALARKHDVHRPDGAGGVVLRLTDAVSEAAGSFVAFWIRATPRPT